jgi:phage terminase large subunit GpA-like protein
MADIERMTMQPLALNAFARGWKPRRRLNVSDWADENRILASEGSAEPGRWRTARNPPMREILDALSEHAGHSLVALMKPSQWGGTEIGVNWLGYIIAHAGGPVAVVMPTEKSLNDWMAQKFDPMAWNTPAVGAMLSVKSNASSDNSAQRKRFRGGILYAKTAGSTAELKAASLRYALADEVDEWARDGKQGGAFDLLKIRTSAFWNSTLFAVSSPTVKDASTIEDLFEKGDRRRCYVACPHCGARQIMAWPSLQFSRAANDRGVVTKAWFVCQANGCVIEEHEKSDMLTGAVWVADNPEGRYPSFHINALYTPVGLGPSWAELAQEWIDAQDDITKLVVFVNTRLAEPWADRSRDIKANAIESRAEPYQLRTLPEDCVVVTAGVDTQDNRLEIQIIGHGKGGKIWVLDYHVLPGNPADDGLWERLADYLNAAEFSNAAGARLKIEATGIDTGGHHTHAVYQFVRSRRIRRALALKGASTAGRIILGKPSLQDVTWRGVVAKKGVALYTVGTDTAKHLLFNLLHDDADKAPAERKLHFSNELEAGYYEQLTAECFNPRRNRWELKKGKRNEALDTWVYALAAAHHPELYVHKWRAADWARRAAMLTGASVAALPEQTATPSPANAARRPPAPSSIPFSKRW